MNDRNTKIFHELSFFFVYERLSFKYLKTIKIFKVEIETRAKNDGASNLIFTEEETNIQAGYTIST